MRKIIFFILSLLLISLNLWAGTTGKIVGRVSDTGTGDVLIGVNVLIEGTDLGAATDIDGSFIILNVPPGKYNILFNYIGYADVLVKEVQVNVDFTTTLEMEMTEATLQTEEVVVIAEREVIRKDQTSSLAIITSEAIRELPVNDIADVLQIQAGVTRDQGGGFHLRGGRSSEINYMVDGVSATDVYDGSVAFEVDKDAVSELQVITGTFNAEYGAALSGVINVITKDGSNDFKGQATVFGGDFYTTHTDLFADGDNFNFTSTPNIQASFSGPIIPNTLTFFVSGRYLENENYLWGARRYYPDGSDADSSAVAMNWFNQGFAQAKLTMKFTPTMKLSYNFIFNNREWRDYEHSQQLSPDGRLQKFEEGYNNTLRLDHTINEVTFYTVNLSLFTKEYNQYAYENVVAWESPSSPGYIDPLTLIDILPSTSNSFNAGYTDNNRFMRKTETVLGRFDFNYQSGAHHLIKAGAEIQSHTIDFKNSDIYFLNEFLIDPETFYTDSEGKTDFTAQRLDPNFSKYTQTPKQYAVYAQDKMEYGDFVLNFGLRLDVFDPDARVPKDKYKFTPDIYKTEFFDDGEISAADEAEFYRDTEITYQVSPRIGVAYSVTEFTKFHFSFGQFLKTPSMELLYTNTDYRILPANKFGNLVGNPDLKPERTSAYEVGFTSMLNMSTSATVTAFYKDIRDYVGTSDKPVLWDNNSANGYGYFFYTNLDYANIRGITLAVNKAFTDSWAFTADYTFMIAEGTASNPGEYYSGGEVSGEEVNRFFFPLDWDQTHTLNGTFFYDFSGWGISFIGKMNSGQPYSPSFATGFATGLSSIRYFNKNKGEKPITYYLDFNLRKRFNFDDKYNLTFFIKVFNLLDIQNEIDVHGDSGRAGYSTAANKQRENEIASGLDQDPSFIRYGTFDEYMLQPYRYSAPRQIQLGLTFDF